MRQTPIHDLSVIAMIIQVHSFEQRDLNIYSCLSVPIPVLGVFQFDFYYTCIL